MSNTSVTDSPKLLDLIRGKIRLKDYSIRTEQAYVDWLKRFILHFDKQHLKNLDDTTRTTIFNLFSRKEQGFCQYAESG